MRVVHAILIYIRVVHAILISMWVAYAILIYIWVAYAIMLSNATLFHRALSDLVNMRTNNPVLGAQAQVCVTCPPDRSNRAPILARPPTYAGIPRGAISGFVGKWFDRRG